MKKIVIIEMTFLLLLGGWPGKSFSQARDETQQWAGCFVKTRHKKFFTRSDVQLRWADNLNQWRTILFRSGVKISLKRLYVMVGPAFFLSSAHGRFLFRKEYRFWQETGFEKNLKKLNYMIRFRAEQRWIEKNEQQLSFFHRFRLKAETLIKFKTVSTCKSGILLSNEILIQFDKRTGIYPDHDRISTGIQYYFNEKMGVQAQYIYIPFIKVNDGEYHRRQVIRLNLQLDL